ncbi:MAG: SRPBCC family protein [Nocardioidaceae bacterium]|nr:SRPBCC family protein [Nocardioidaceae bacterium]
MAPYLLSSSEVFATTPEVAYDTLVAAPLEALFTQRSGPIPPVARTEGQTGEWGTAGATRRVVLADGGSNLETLVGADRATRDYRYELTDFRGPMKLLVAKVEGRFAFDAAGAGTRVTWTWRLHATNPVTRLALPVLGAFWRPWAKAMWPRYEARLP